MADHPPVFADQEQMKKFWAQAMSHVDLDALAKADSHELAKHMLSTTTDKLEAMLKNAANMQVPPLGMFSRSSEKEKYAANVARTEKHNASVDFILHGDPSTPSEQRPASEWDIYPKATTLQEIRAYIESGRYDKAFDALEHGAGVMHDHPKLQNMYGFESGARHTEESATYNPRFVFRLFAKERNGNSFIPDYNQLRAFLLENGYIGRDPKHAYDNDYEIGFSLSPAAIEATRQLIAQQEPTLTGEDRTAYESIALRITSEGDDRKPNQTLVTTPATDACFREEEARVRRRIKGGSAAVKEIIEGDSQFQVALPLAVKELRALSQQNPESEGYREKLQKTLDQLTTVYADAVTNNIDEITKSQGR